MPDTSLYILAIAVAVYALLQLLKRYTPGICGKHAVAVNLVLSAVGTIIATRPGNVHDLTALLLETALTAAGIHGTVRSLSRPNPCDTGTTPDISGQKPL